MVPPQLWAAPEVLLNADRTDEAEPSPEAAAGTNAAQDFARIGDQAHAIKDISPSEIHDYESTTSSQPPLLSRSGETMRITRAPTGARNLVALTPASCPMKS